MHVFLVVVIKTLPWNNVYHIFVVMMYHFAFLKHLYSEQHFDKFPIMLLFSYPCGFIKHPVPTEYLPILSNFGNTNLLLNFFLDANKSQGNLTFHLFPLLTPGSSIYKKWFLTFHFPFSHPPPFPYSPPLLAFHLLKMPQNYNLRYPTCKIIFKL